MLLTLLTKHFLLCLSLVSLSIYTSSFYASLITKGLPCYLGHFIAATNNLKQFLTGRTCISKYQYFDSRSTFLQCWRATREFCLNYYCLFMLKWCSYYYSGSEKRDLTNVIAPIIVFQIKTAVQVICFSILSPY